MMIIRGLSIRIIVAVLAFVLGIAATMVWFISRRSADQNVRLIIPRRQLGADFFQAD